jgi:PRTRC genetic system protein A
MSTIHFSTLVGHHVATPTLPPLSGVYEYLFAANGLFLRAEGGFLSVQVCIHAWPPGTVRGLPSLAPYIHLHHPYLPCALLRRILTDARTRQDADGALVEALYRVVRRGTQFALIVPPQEASVASVKARTSDTPEPPLLELHSHGSLPAFWSSQDDRDEGGFYFYGVVGKVDTDRPEIRLRLGVYGYWWEVPVGVLFAEHEPPEWQDLNVASPSPYARWLQPEREAI